MEGEWHRSFAAALAGRLQPITHDQSQKLRDCALLTRRCLRNFVFHRGRQTEGESGFVRLFHARLDISGQINLQYPVDNMSYAVEHKVPSNHEVAAMKFPTHAVLSTCTGRLMGDIGGVYKVSSFLVGRDVFTHELPYYGKRAERALRAALPALPGRGDFRHVNADNYRAVLAEWEAKLGTEIDLPDSLRECLADDKNALGTLREMVPDEKIIVIKP